jgi:DNA-binding IclR family transcriptional regulator
MNDASASRDPEAAILEALRRAGRPSSAEEVAAATGIAEASVRRTLGRLASQREVARAGGGKFTIARHRRSG